MTEARFHMDGSAIGRQLDGSQHKGMLAMKMTWERRAWGDNSVSGKGVGL